MLSKNHVSLIFGCSIIVCLLQLQHSQWYRQRRQAAVDVRFIKRLIFFNESVNYKDNTINITDSDNIETDRLVNRRNML